MHLVVAHKCLIDTPTKPTSTDQSVAESVELVVCEFVIMFFTSCVICFGL